MPRLSRRLSSHVPALEPMRPGASSESVCHRSTPATRSRESGEILREVAFYRPDLVRSSTCIARDHIGDHGFPFLGTHAAVRERVNAVALSAHPVDDRFA